MYLFAYLALISPFGPLIPGENCAFICTWSWNSSLGRVVQNCRLECEEPTPPGEPPPLPPPPPCDVQLIVEMATIDVETAQRYSMPATGGKGQWGNLFEVTLRAITNRGPNEIDLELNVTGLGSALNFTRSGAEEAVFTFDAPENIRQGNFTLQAKAILPCIQDQQNSSVKVYPLGEIKTDQAQLEHVHYLREEGLGLFHFCQSQEITLNSSDSLTLNSSISGGLGVTLLRVIEAQLSQANSESHTTSYSVGQKLTFTGNQKAQGEIYAKWYEKVFKLPITKYNAVGIPTTLSNVVWISKPAIYFCFPFGDPCNSSYNCGTPSEF